MSLESDLRSLIGKADASLQNLKDLLQESPQKVRENPLLSSQELQDGFPHQEMMEACERTSLFIRQMETVCSENQRRLNQLEKALQRQIESLESDAANHFRKGEYRECLATVTFLSVLKPNDSELRDCLELCQKKLEEGPGPTETVPVEHYPVEAGKESLDRLMATGVSVDSKPAGPLSEDSASGSVACNLENHASSSSVSLIVVPHPSMPTSTSIGLSKLFLQRRFAVNLNWALGLIVLFVFASLLFGLAIGTRALFTTHGSSSRNADPYGGGVLENDREKMPVGMTSLEAENPGVSNMKDSFLPEAIDQVSSEETAQALFDVGRLKEADATCKAILKRNPKNGFALRLRTRVLEYYISQTEQSRPKAFPNKTRNNLRDSAQPGFLRFEQILQPQAPHPPVVTTTNFTAVAHAGTQPALEDAAVNQQSMAISWIQKAKSAMLSGQYITPAHDNVLVYCRRALAIDPKNTEALFLKRESFVKALSKAKEWINKGEYEEALLLYSSLCYLSRQENGSPYSVQDLQQELDRLEFKAYPVVHLHVIGSCTGRLRLNGHAISFVPSGPSEDGFSEKLENISVTANGDIDQTLWRLRVADNHRERERTEWREPQSQRFTLKLKIGAKVYRFRGNLGKSEEESRESLEGIYKQLVLLTGPARQ